MCFFCNSNLFKQQTTKKKTKKKFKFELLPKQQKTKKNKWKKIYENLCFRKIDKSDLTFKEYK